MGAGSSPRPASALDSGSVVGAEARARPRLPVRLEGGNLPVPFANAATNLAAPSLALGGSPSTRAGAPSPSPTDPQEPTNAPPVLEMQMVWINPGSFAMGSAPEDFGARPNEFPQTTVTLTRGFWMGRFEVTVAQYRALMDPADVPVIYRELAEDDPESAAIPVSRVCWQDAMRFCELLSLEKERAGELPAGYVYRLPTEAEWEYACRGGTRGPFSFGGEGEEATVARNACFRMNSAARTRPVGSFPANPFGLYDMHGNLAELCLDYLRTYPGGSVADPVGEISGRVCVSRGGAWNAGPEGIRSAVRYPALSSRGMIDLGFRVVLAATR